MGEVCFFVEGRCVPQPRPRVTERGTVSNVGRVKTWRGLVALAAKRARIGVVHGPVALGATFVMKRPLAVPVELKGRLYHTKRPDIDNLEKALLDGLGDAGIFGDDAQVCVRLPGGKFYGAEGERVGVEVVLRWGRELVGNSFGERAE